MLIRDESWNIPAGARRLAGVGEVGGGGMVSGGRARVDGLRHRDPNRRARDQGAGTSSVVVKVIRRSVARGVVGRASASDALSQ